MQRRVLWIALLANATFMVVEIAGGFVFGSLALLADALHMGSDVAGLAIALVAQSLITRPASARHTYGMQRAEVLGAQANGLLLLATSMWVFYEAIVRLGSPEPIDGGGLLTVATIGLGVNLGSAVLLNRVQGHSLNMRGAFLHMAMDAAGSVGAMVAGLGVLVAGADWLDPVMSMLIGALVLWAAWSLLRDTTSVLLEGTPRGLDVGRVEMALLAGPGVEAVHHLHVWDLASNAPALSAHVILGDQLTLHDAQDRGAALHAMLADEFGIDHSTLELECHECDGPNREHAVAFGSAEMVGRAAEARSAPMTTTLDARDADTGGDERGAAGRRRGPGPLQVIGLVVAVAFTAGVLGWRIAQPSHPGRDSVDVGFLHDMLEHHEQAIGLSFAYLDNGEDPLLRHFAKETITYQAAEIGWFNQLLTEWGQNGSRPEPMTWMGMAHGRRMPGMASEAEIKRLQDARGLDAGDQFTRLMIRHHRGGVHMASYAAEHAETSVLRERAAAMAAGQSSEIAELNTQREELGLPRV